MKRLVVIDALEQVDLSYTPDDRHRPAARSERVRLIFVEEDVQ